MNVNEQDRRWAWACHAERQRSIWSRDGLSCWAAAKHLVTGWRISLPQMLRCRSAWHAYERLVNLSARSRV